MYPILINCNLGIGPMLPSSLYITCFVILVICASIIDLREYRIPNVLSLILLGIGIAYSVSIKNHTIWVVFVESLAVFLFFWFFSWSFYKLRGSVGLGLGDVKMIAALTPWLGLVNIPIMLFIASLTGLIFVVPNRQMTGMFLSTKLPFAPFLSFAGCLVLFATSYWGDNLTEIFLAY